MLRIDKQITKTRENPTRLSFERSDTINQLEIAYNMLVIAQMDSPAINRLLIDLMSKAAFGSFIISGRLVHIKFSPLRQNIFDMEFAIVLIAFRN